MYDHGLIYWDIRSLCLYLFVLFWGVIAAKFFQKTQEGLTSINWKGLVIMFVPMFLVLVLRESTRGTDLPRYFWLFQELSRMSEVNSFNLVGLLTREPIFNTMQLVLSRITSGMTDEYMLLSFLITVTVVWMFFACKAIKEESTYIGVVWPFVILFVLFFIPAFNLLRNVIAVFVMLYAYTQLAEKRYLKFWFFCLIAIGIHYTSLVCAISYFFVYEGKSARNTAIRRVIIAAAMFAFVFIGKDIIVGFFGDYDSKYANFATREQFFALGQTFIRLPLLMLVCYFKKELISINPHNKLYISLIWFDLFVGQLNYIDQQFTRCALYFTALQIFILPSIYKIMINKFGLFASNLISIIFVSIWFFYRVDYYLYDNPYYFMPYISNFFN